MLTQTIAGMVAAAKLRVENLTVSEVSAESRRPGLERSLEA